MGLFSSGDDDERDAEYVIIDEEKRGRGDGCDVTIPTKSDEKSISQTGWSVGGFVERSSSSGEVVDKPLEAYCVLFLVRDQELVVGLRDKTKSAFPSKTPSKTLYITYDEIRGVTSPTSGILSGTITTTLTTEFDEFKFRGLNAKRKSGISDDDLEEYILERMRRSRGSNQSTSQESTQSSNQSTSQESSQPSLSQELNQISSLHESGVLSDEEFKAAKEQILSEETGTEIVSSEDDVEPSEQDDDPPKQDDDDPPKQDDVEPSEQDDDPPKQDDVEPSEQDDDPPKQDDDPPKQKTPLTNISGIGSTKAESLRVGGYESVEEIQEASQAELAEVDEIGKALAARIKADVGDS